MVDKIKILCKAKGIGINELEDILEFGNGAIYNWKKSSPRVSSLKKVADYFGVTVNDLLDYPPQQALSSFERSLLDMVRELNTEGQDRLLEQARYLVQDPKYCTGYIKNNVDSTVEGIA